MNGFFDVALSGKRDVPEAGVELHRDALNFAFELTLHRPCATAETQPTDLRQRYPLIVNAETLWEPDTLRVVFFLECGQFGSELWIEGALVGFHQIVERLLQRLRVRLTQKRIFRFEIEQPQRKTLAPDRQRITLGVPELVLEENRIPNKT